MTNGRHRSLKEGLGLGIIAGVIFAIVEIAGAAMMGNPPLMPLRMFASVVLGQAALATVSLGVAVLVGTIAHLVLSALFGLIYVALNRRLSPAAQASRGSQSLMGLVFGAAVWLVNFQIIARILYPWFLGTPQFLQFMMHALFFGLPLGLLYARSERRARAVRPAPAPA